MTATSAVATVSCVTATVSVRTVLMITFSRAKANTYERWVI